MAHLLSRRLQTEEMFLTNPSIVAHRHNKDLLQNEEASYDQRRNNAIEDLQNFEFEKPPLWENKVGFMERTRKENQKAIIAAVTSGNFVTFALCLINTLFIYRAPAMFLSICQAPHLRRKIALKTLKNYGLDLWMFVKIVLICISVYKIPDLISALVVSLLHKRSIKAARKAVDAIPSEVFSDLVKVLKILLSWKTVAYTFSSLLFLLLMPLSVMIKVFTGLLGSTVAACIASGLLYAALLSLAFVIPLVLPDHMDPSVEISYLVTGYMFVIVLILIGFVLLHTRSRDRKHLATIDYVRINWFNLHVYLKLIIEVMQLVAVIFTVKMTYLPHNETFSTISKYILLDVYPRDVKLAILCLVFVIWFFTASIPIILEEILEYVEKGTFSKGHFTWRAFLSFFGITLFMVIPEIGLSMLSCNYSAAKDDASYGTMMDDASMKCWSGNHAPYAVFSLFSIMWYLLTSTLICLSFNDSENKKVDLQFCPTYTAIENILKVGIITVVTLFRNNIYSLVAASGLLLAQIVLTCTWKAATDTKPANYFRLIILKIGSLGVVLSCAITIVVVEKLETTASESLYILAGVVGFLILMTALACVSGYGLVRSEQEVARDEFKKLSTKLVSKLESLDGMCDSWSAIRYQFRRMLKHVRVAYPKDWMPADQAVPSTLVQSNFTEEPPPPSYEELPTIETLPEPPSYDTILAEKIQELQADECFVPDSSIYLSPFGDWEPYDAAKVLESDGWMIASAMDGVIELTDVQCTGSDLLLLLEQHIKYYVHSYEFVADLQNWRQQVKGSTWIELLHCAEVLQASITSSFDSPRNSVLTYDTTDLIPPNPDQSTFPLYFELTDVTTIKMKVHTRQREKLLTLVPEPWLGLIEKLIPVDKPFIKQITDINACDSQSSRLTVNLFKPIHITIKEVDAGGFKIARGAKVVIPKSLVIANISSTNIAFSKPYPSGSKGPISKTVECLNATKIDGVPYILVGNGRAKVSKALATLHELDFN